MITPLKLQKLIYFLFGHYFNFSDQKLFNDRFYAWEHGPVIPHLYYQLKKHQANPIPLDTLVWHADFKKEKFMPASLSDLTNNQFNILYSIWEHYSQIDARKLVILSHQKNTPWDKTYEHGFEKLIPHKRIKTFFLKNPLNEKDYERKKMMCLKNPLGGFFL